MHEPWGISHPASCLVAAAPPASSLAGAIALIVEWSGMANKPLWTTAAKRRSARLVQLHSGDPDELPAKARFWTMRLGDPMFA